MSAFFGIEKDSLVHELIQVAAVATCWLEATGLSQSDVFALISAERDAQDAKWGSQHHLSSTLWAAILGEEYGEVCKAVLNEHSR